MSNLLPSIEEIQRAFCLERNATYAATPAESILGFAASTRGKKPFNGLRHAVAKDTNGWYLWCGEEYSSAAEFYSPMHAEHIYEEFPEIIKLFGLPPGFRFLWTGAYLDIWRDPSLLL